MKKTKIHVVGAIAAALAALAGLALGAGPLPADKPNPEARTELVRRTIEKVRYEDPEGLFAPRLSTVECGEDATQDEGGPAEVFGVELGAGELAGEPASVGG